MGNRARNTINVSSSYAEDIVPDVDDANRKCGIKLTKVKEKDNGVWKCKLDVVKDVSRTESNQTSFCVLHGKLSLFLFPEKKKPLQKTYISGEGDINVTVALAPREVELNAEGQVGENLGKWRASTFDY